MRQQINLYYPIFRKQPKKFSATTMLQASAGVFFGILLIYTYTQWQVAGLRAELAQAEAQHVGATKRLQQLSKTMATSESENAADRELARLEREVAARAAVERLLQEGALGNSRGFAEFMLAFARQHVPGVWLIGFEIVGNREQVTLDGRSISPELVPNYIQKLSQEESLAGAEFQVFKMTRPEEKGRLARHIDFRVGTRADSEEDDRAGRQGSRERAE